MNTSMSRWVSAVVGVVALTACASAPASGPDGGDPRGDVVTTDAGAVRGTLAEDHRLFQGIPYAAPPVGELRWAAPQPAPPWDGVHDATTPGPACAQVASYVADIGSESEDCLSVNVTTPTTGGAAKPVLVDPRRHRNQRGGKRVRRAGWRWPRTSSS